MTLPKGSLLPAGSDDGGKLLRALELVARGAVKLGQVVGAVVGQGVALEPGPQVLHVIDVRCVGRQEPLTACSPPFVCFKGMSACLRPGYLSRQPCILKKLVGTHLMGICDVHI